MKTECIHLKKKATKKQHKELEDYLIYHKKWRGSGSNEEGMYCMVKWDDDIDKMVMLFCFAGAEIIDITNKDG